ncbi:AraC family transcriptional regulator [Listeria sp. FSL L7-1582]|nr:AraC family transcriptional regulator [Listeria portnoyi]
MEAHLYESDPHQVIRMLSEVALMTTKQPVTAIAEESGYTDRAYFYRQFKKYTGYTPNGFRKKEKVQ